MKNDFYSSVSLTLIEVGIQKSEHEIKVMKKSDFKNLVREQCHKSAFIYLKKKQLQGSKGRHIKYSNLKMEDYLLPQANISIEDQRDIFSIRCRTNPLGANRGILEYCETKCGEVLDNAHIFSCIVLNTNEEKYKFETLLNGCTLEKKKYLKIWRENMKKREKYLGTQFLL